jgi:transposase
MVESGLVESSEQLHRIPAQLEIHVIERAIYKCSGCQDQLIATAGDPRIAPGSSMSDGFILESALAKFGALTPADRKSSNLRSARQKPPSRQGVG